MKDIVVLAGSTPWSVLSLCKEAYGNKVKAYAVCVKNGWGRKYAKCRYIYKAYDTKEEIIESFWKQFFIENIFEEKPILYVTNDYVCQIIEKNRMFYEERFELCMASSYIINSFIDKNIAAIEAEKHGLTVPKTQVIHDLKDICIVCDSFCFPVIVKPVTFQDHINSGFKTQICETAEQLKSFVPKHLANSIHLQCQEYIKGDDKDCVFYQFYRDQEGNITECMGEKTLQSNGIMTVGTTKFDRQLASISRTFLQSIDYVGIGGIEFKHYDGKYYFIEMSVRTEGFLAISDMAGVSLAKASLLAMNGKGFNEKRQKEGIQYVVFFPFLVKAIKSYGYFFAIRQFIRVLFSTKASFTGAFLDLCFALKLDLGVIK